MREFDNKIYFKKGDTVIVKQDLCFKPKMVVKLLVKETLSYTEHAGKRKHKLLGVLCWWYTLDGVYQEKRFNTKDLENA